MSSSVCACSATSLDPLTSVGGPAGEAFRAEHRPRRAGRRRRARTCRCAGRRRRRGLIAAWASHPGRPAGRPGGHRRVARPVSSRVGSSTSPRVPGRNEVTRSPGRSAPRVGPTDLEHLRHRDQPPHQPEQGRVDLLRLVSAMAGPGVDAHHRPLPRHLGQERLPGPAAGQRRSSAKSIPRSFHTPIADESALTDSSARRVGGWRITRHRRSGSSGAPSTRRSRDGPTGRTGTATPTSTRPPTASSSATAGFVWGPEGLTEDDGGRAGRGGRQGRARGRVRAPGSARGGCAARAAGPSGWTSPPRQLQHSRRHRRGDRRGRFRRCAAPPPHLPFADAVFDVVFSSFGALQFVADIEPGRRRDGPGAAPRAAGSPSPSPTRPAGCSPTTRAPRA